MNGPAILLLCLVIIVVGGTLVYWTVGWLISMFFAYLGVCYKAWRKRLADM